MLTALDALPDRPRRVLVAGVSGAGKTTLAGRMGVILGVPHTEIDELYHGPGWQPRADFMSDVEHLASAAAWTTEWQYSAARPLLAERAELLVWLDFPVPVSMSRLVRRTVRRRLRQEELWNGNIEPAFWSFFTDPDHIVRWGWRTRHKLRSVVPGLELEFPGLCVVRLASPRDVETWVDNLQHSVASGW